MNLDQLISVALGESEQQSPGGTLVVENHLAQMVLFMVRKGIELLPEQDDRFGSRKKFIKKLWSFNQLGIHLEHLVRTFCAKGKLLFYLRPTEGGDYEIDFFDKDQFRDYYDENRTLDKVIIRYSYKEALPNDVGFSLGGYHGNDGPSPHAAEGTMKFVKLVITKDEIKKSVSDSLPTWNDLDPRSSIEVYKNTLGFLPCVVARSCPKGKGGDSDGDFDRLASHIEGHDRMSRAAYNNLIQFGNPSLITTREASEVLETAMEEETIGNGIYSGRHSTNASEGGFFGRRTPSTLNTSVPYANAGMGNRRVKKVIGGVGPEERFGYISPDPITPDHARSIRENNEKIHWALGGIDELGLSANATAYERKSVFGRVDATTERKALGLYTYGLCKVVEMAIAAEEDLFKRTYLIALNRVKDPAEPTIILTEAQIRERIELEGVPRGVFGLPPLGSREVIWRYTGPVFVDSPRDKLDKSIVARNFQELGVGSKEALQTVFEGATEDELEEMLSGGFPFRYSQAVMNSAEGALRLFQATLPIPDPENPGQSLGIRFLPIVVRAIETLYTELSYKEKYEPASPGDIPEYANGIAPYERFARQLAGIPEPASRSAGQLPTTGRQYAAGTYDSVGNPFLVDQSNPSVGGSPFGNDWGQPVPAAPAGAGFYGPGGQLGGGNDRVQPDYAASIPGPGTTVPSGSSLSGTRMGWPNPTNYGPATDFTLPPDLAVGAVAGDSLFQLFGEPGSRRPAVRDDRGAGRRVRRPST